jgi:poly(3-hydroxybutyrate) depolymerase
VSEIKTKLCLDTTRIFAAGGSNGGMLTWELGQNASSAPIFRAIAPIIGLPHRGYLDAPGKLNGMPVLVITGTRDTTVPPGAWEDAGHTMTRDSDRYYYTGASDCRALMGHDYGLGWSWKLILDFFDAHSR